MRAGSKQHKGGCVMLMGAARGREWQGGTRPLPHMRFMCVFCMRSAPWQVKTFTVGPQLPREEGTSKLQSPQQSKRAQSAR